MPSKKQQNATNDELLKEILFIKEMVEGCTNQLKILRKMLKTLTFMTGYLNQTSQKERKDLIKSEGKKIKEAIDADKKPSSKKFWIKIASSVIAIAGLIGGLIEVIRIYSIR